MAFLGFLSFAAFVTFVGVLAEDAGEKAERERWCRHNYSALADYERCKTKPDWDANAPASD